MAEQCSCREFEDQDRDTGFQPVPVAPTNERSFFSPTNHPRILNMDASYERALILYQQHRFDLAEKELKQSLAGDPHKAEAHAMLALCLAQRQAYADASAEADQAVGLAPDLPFAHYARASILLERRRYNEAALAIHEALRLNSYDPDYYSLQARVRFSQRRWQDALESAENGLAIQADHSGCGNLRAMALTQLGRREEAAATLGQSLSRDPHNATTHANQGWTYLHQGDHKKALEHFREALRIDPELDWARAGMVEALKAHYLIYRLMLRYFLWMNRLAARAQWGIIIGAFVGYQLVLRAANTMPQLAPFLYPLVAIYIVFVYLTWTASPLFNLLLQLNRFGRYALSRDQRIASIWVGAAVGLAIISATVWAVTREFAALAATIYCLLMVIALAATFRRNQGWPRWVMMIYTAGLAAIGAGAIVAFYFAPRLGSDTLLDNARTLANAFLIGIFLQSILSNMLAGMTIKK